MSAPLHQFILNTVIICCHKVVVVYYSYHYIIKANYTSQGELDRLSSDSMKNYWEFL
jgi:hypothetical protein